MQSVRDCTDWSVGNTHRHRCTKRGYASPEVADDLALRVLLKLEEMRQRRGMAFDQIVLCGVDNSTTAFAMAVLRLMPAEARYSFCSGKKATSEEVCGCMDCDLCCGELDDCNYPSKAVYVVIDDDMGRGRAVRTVASKHDEVHWFGIHFYLKDSTQWEYDGIPDWLTNCTFHWWGKGSYSENAPEPEYKCETGDEVIEWVVAHYPD